MVLSRRTMRWLMMGALSGTARRLSRAQAAENPLRFFSGLFFCGVAREISAEDEAVRLLMMAFFRVEKG
jgi:hypothetical protein